MDILKVNILRSYLTYLEYGKKLEFKTINGYWLPIQSLLTLVSTIENGNIEIRVKPEQVFKEVACFWSKNCVYPRESWFTKEESTALISDWRRISDWVKIEIKDDIVD
jgi:hypothetical protein